MQGLARITQGSQEAAALGTLRAGRGIPGTGGFRVTSAFGRGVVRFHA